MFIVEIFIIFRSKVEQHISAVVKDSMPYNSQSIAININPN